MSRPDRLFARRHILKAVSRAACLTAIVATSAVAAPAAATPTRSEREIARCIARAANGSDWLEKTLWGLRDQEGGWIGAEIANTNGSHDLGPLQINSWWVRKVATVLRQPEQDVRFWLKSDACFNVDVARWIFLSALRSTGDYWAAIGVYHSPTGWRQRRYTLSVIDHLTRRFGPAIFAGTSSRSNDFPRTTMNRASDPAADEARGERVFGFGDASRTAAAGTQD